MELEIENLERALTDKGYTQPQVWLGIKVDWQLLLQHHGLQSEGRRV